MTREQDELQEIARHAQAQVDYMVSKATSKEVVTNTLIDLVARAIDKEAMDGQASPWNIGRGMAIDKALAAITAIEASGHAIVPAEPTEEMQHADGEVYVSLVAWEALLAARPKVLP